MLKHLQIKNFALIDNLDHALLPGMTVMTGETGAGKSIIIDALSLVLGGRSNAKFIRQHADYCEVCGAFDIHEVKQIQAFLREHALEDDDDKNMCILRRVINQDGRSKAFVNGRIVSLSQLKTLSNYLINIHGQHENQSLMNHDIQRQMLDAFAGHDALIEKVKTAYQTWLALKKEWQALTRTQQDHAHLELMQYQLQELTQAACQPGEVEALHQEQKILANAQHVLQDCADCLTMISDPDAGLASQTIQASMQRLAPHLDAHNPLQTAYQLLENASIQIQEAENEIRDYIDTFDSEPDRLQHIESRLSQLHALARKHHCQAEALPTRQQDLEKQCQALTQFDDIANALQIKLQSALAQYQKVANTLSTSRKKAANKLSKLVTENIHALHMAQGKFHIEFKEQEDATPHLYGQDRIAYHVSTNPGMPSGPLHKIASGGELSRISLAIQVIIAKCYKTPVLIFDEVDVGIGGATAEVVGQLLKQLSESAQILCITHLPQVAACATHHVIVEKTQSKQATASTLTLLNQSQRIEEIARMLGGVKITKQTRLHAAEMLETA